MKKSEYFKLATKAGCHKKRAWVLSAFTLTQEPPEAWKNNPYQYRIVQTPTGHFFVNDQQQLEKIDGTEAGIPPFKVDDGIKLDTGDYPNVSKPIVASLGNILFNLCAIVPAFGSKVEFITGEIDVSNIEEKIITPRLKDTLKPGEKPDPNFLYVNEYIKFCDSFNYITEFNHMCTIALTPKAVSQAPGIVELRTKLIAENQDKIHDPVVVANIEKELLKHDAEFLKGDPSEKFLISKKSRDTVRKRLFVDYGTNTSLTNDYKVDMIEKSLCEGWDTTKLPEMIDSLRAGSYDRGSETQKGGAAVKFLYRGSSNIRILDQDCGSKLGTTIDVKEYNLPKIIGMRVIESNGTKLVETKEDASQYLGKKIMVRSPLYCKLPFTDYCRHCVGERLGTNPSSGAGAITGLGSAAMLVSMKSFHASSTKLVRINLEDYMF